MIKSMTEILIEMCDSFDSYIAPKKIRRDNTNFIYLIIKAIAKGYEVLYSVFVTLQGKFDPAVCSDRDLESIAKIAGTSRKAGKGSALLVTILNTGLDSVTLETGQYYYEYSAGIRFLFTITQSVLLNSLDSVQFAAFSEEEGPFLVEAVSNLPVLRVDENAISSDLLFSCSSNEGMLGFPAESRFDFRRRILDDTSRQDTIKEMELEISNLPYVFDCKLVFNQTPDAEEVDGVMIPPYHLLVVLNGDPRDEIAEIIASYGIYPSTVADVEKVLYFTSDVFLNGKYPVYYKLFEDYEYAVQVDYTYNPRLNEDSLITGAMDASLKRYKDNVQHVSFITEATFYDVIRSLSLQSVNLLNITLKVDGSPVDYVDVPPTRIPRLSSVVFNGTPV